MEAPLLVAAPSCAPPQSKSRHRRVQSSHKSSRAGCTGKSKSNARAPAVLLSDLTADPSAHTDAVDRIATLACRQWGAPSFSSLGHGLLADLLTEWADRGVPQQLPEDDNLLFTEPLLQVLALVHT
eukprot:1134250-Pelagomonas_calceolata.AAC.7